MQTDFPKLFSDKGVFLGYSADVLESLTPQRRELYDAVAAAADAMKFADAELTAATEAVRDAMDAVREAEKQQPPAISFHDLWRQTFGRPRA